MTEERISIEETTGPHTIENASLTELEFEMGTESSDDYTESPQLAAPTHDTHKTRNFHYPPPETMTPTVNLMIYSFSSWALRQVQRNPQRVRTTGFNVCQGVYATSFVVRHAN